MDTTGQLLLKMFGEQGFKNLKAHAESVNMSLEQMRDLAEVAPIVLLQMLCNAAAKKHERALEAVAVGEAG